jgi:hypothetical protein
MPSEYLIDTEQRLVISRGTGIFGHADFLEHMDAVGPDPRFKPEFNHLVDARHFERFDLTPVQLMDMGSRTNFGAESRRAFVVSSLLHFGLGRMFANYRGAQHGQLTKIFTEMGSAIAWLGLPPDYDPNRLGPPTRVGKSD